MKSFVKQISSAEDEYIPSWLPMSPILKSFFVCWSPYDLPIGARRIARVSCRLLRYYEQLGLLKPAIVDRASGYRFYSATQLPELNRILVLKELGLSLDQITRATSNAISAVSCERCYSSADRMPSTLWRSSRSDCD